MNIVGAGIYLSFSAGSSTRTSTGVQGVQPANSYGFVQTSSSTNTIRYDMYCCSNSTSSSNSITFPNGRSRSSNYDNIRIRQYYSYSDSYAGCIRMTHEQSSYYYYSRYRSYSLSTSYRGIHTCNIRDSRGNRLLVNFGVYEENYNLRSPSIYGGLLFSSSWSSSVVLVCKVRYSPPSSIQWYHNNVLLSVNDSSTTMNVRVTDRTYYSSFPDYYRYGYRYRDYVSYEITLSICASPDDVVGLYRCSVGNKAGRDSESYQVRGLQTYCHNGFIVGRTSQCSCSSDLAYSSFQWYNGSRLLSYGSTLTLPVSTDNEGEVYTCAMSSSCGTQQKSITISTTVPDEWSSVHITRSAYQNVLENSDYTLTCSVRAISGMNLPVRIEWVGPDGAVVESEGNRNVRSGASGEDEESGSGSGSGSGTGAQEHHSSLTLSFRPIFSSDGGRYTCRASIIVPWMTRQPPLRFASVHVTVATQAMFQLKLYPLPHCSNWDVSKAYDVEDSIKREVEQAIRERCDCAFRSSAIHGGEFSCQTYADYNRATHVTYRAILNGTSDLLPAHQLMQHMQDWRASHNTLLYNVFRLRMSKIADCNLSIDSFEDEECS